MQKPCLLKVCTGMMKNPQKLGKTSRKNPDQGNMQIAETCTGDISIISVKIMENKGKKAAAIGLFLPILSEILNLTR